MLVANYTPDEIEWQHVGITGFLKPGDVEEFEGNRGNHILNKWGPRGLIRVTKDWATTEPEDRAKAMRIYRNFWMRQITTFNQHNESLKNENKPYVHPSSQLAEKAVEFEVELIAPWKLIQKTDNAEIEALKGEVNALKSMLMELIDATKKIEDKPKLGVKYDPADVEGILKMFRNLGKDKFQNWVFKHAELMHEWPPEVMTELTDKWARLYPDEEWPIPA